MIYNNHDLARDYLRLMLQRPGNNFTYRKIAHRIEEYSINIAAHYAQHHSLEGLKVKWLGEKTSTTLELILHQGIEQVMNSHHQKREVSIRKKFSRGVLT